VTVCDDILAAFLAALEPLAEEVELEPASDPIDFPALGITDGGWRVLEHEADITRRVMIVTVDGFVEGEGGAAPTAARNTLQAAVVAAVMADETLGGTVELIEDADLRKFTAEMSTQRRLGFAQDFAVQFTTSRADPAQAA
jgi:hypothetical protein